MPQEPCIFISHSSLDKPAARSISKYINDMGVNTYFDENDDCLTEGGHGNSPQGIVQCIHEGLKNSSATLVLISPNSLESKWVPYELGWASRQGCDLALSVLKSVDLGRVPEFYSIVPQLLNEADLRRWVSEQSPQPLKKAHGQIRNQLLEHMRGGPTPL